MSNKYLDGFNRISTEVIKQVHAPSNSVIYISQDLDLFFRMVYVFRLLTLLFIWFVWSYHSEY